MSDSLEAEIVSRNGKEYVSVKEAARLTGYTSDYVGQLARGGKLESELIGKVRFIEVGSLRKHADSSSLLREAGKAGRHPVSKPKWAREEEKNAPELIEERPFGERAEPQDESPLETLRTETNRSISRTTTSYLSKNRAANAHTLVVTAALLLLAVGLSGSFSSGYREWKRFRESAANISHESREFFTPFGFEIRSTSRALLEETVSELGNISAFYGEHVFKLSQFADGSARSEEISVMPELRSSLAFYDIQNTFRSAMRKANEFRQLAYGAPQKSIANFIFRDTTEKVVLPDEVRGNAPSNIFAQAERAILHVARPFEESISSLVDVALAINSVSKNISLHAHARSHTDSVDLVIGNVSQARPIDTSQLNELIRGFSVKGVTFRFADARDSILGLPPARSTPNILIYAKRACAEFLRLASSLTTNSEVMPKGRGAALLLPLTPSNIDFSSITDLLRGVRVGEIAFKHHDFEDLEKIERAGLGISKPNLELSRIDLDRGLATASAGSFLNSLGRTVYTSLCFLFDTCRDTITEIPPEAERPGDISPTVPLYTAQAPVVTKQTRIIERAQNYNLPVLSAAVTFADLEEAISTLRDNLNPRIDLELLSPVGDGGAGGTTVITSSNASTFSSAVGIGRVSSSDFGGHLDDVRMYTPAFSTSEMDRLYRIGQ